jgi:hypothetical protein
MNMSNMFILGQICGYDLSRYKHDDYDYSRDRTRETIIPFQIDIIDGQAIVQLKSTIESLDCELKQTYHFYVRAYDCALDSERRYSERYTCLSNHNLTLFDVLFCSFVIFRFI